MRMLATQNRGERRDPFLHAMEWVEDVEGNPAVTVQGGSDWAVLVGVCSDRLGDLQT